MASMALSLLAAATLFSSGLAQQGRLQDCLTKAVGGRNVAFPNSLLYNKQFAKPYNLDISVSPLAVVSPTTTEQVSAVVVCALQNGSKIQARGGNHGYANFAAGGGDKTTITVDMKNFKQFSIDRRTWEATIGGGTILGDLTKALQKEGRAMAYGTCPQVGFGGHAQMAGMGPASRLWGTTLDHVNEATAVLANGTIVTASPTKFPDLFWALKGAGSSFGIITQFKARTQPSPEGNIQYSYTFAKSPFRDLAVFFKQWQQMTADPNLSRKFASQFVLSPAGLIIQGTFFGSKEELNRLQLPILFPNATASDVTGFRDFLGVIGHWAEDQALSLVGGSAAPFYSKNLIINRETLMSDAAIDRFFAYLDQATAGTPIWFAIFNLAGGAMNDVPPGATSFYHREGLYHFQTYAIGVPRVNDNIRRFLTDLNNLIQQEKPGLYFGAYPGYVDLQLQSPQIAYWGGNYQRLQSLKAVLDPYEVFSNPQSVRLPGRA